MTAVGTSRRLAAMHLPAATTDSGRPRANHLSESRRLTSLRIRQPRHKGCLAVSRSLGQVSRIVSPDCTERPLSTGPARALQGRHQSWPRLHRRVAYMAAFQATDTPRATMRASVDPSGTAMRCSGSNAAPNPARPGMAFASTAAVAGLLLALLELRILPAGKKMVTPPCVGPGLAPNHKA